MPGNSSVSVVEDDGPLRLAMSGLLESLGYRVRAFASAEAFLEDGAARDADCIVTDIQMPGLSGIDLMQRLTDLGVDTPVIMVTARSEAALLRRANASGAFRVLQKPVQDADLLSSIEDAIKR